MGGGQRQHPGAAAGGGRRGHAGQGDGAAHGRGHADALRASHLPRRPVYDKPAHHSTPRRFLRTRGSFSGPAFCRRMHPTDSPGWGTTIHPGTSSGRRRSFSGLARIKSLSGRFSHVFWLRLARQMTKTSTARTGSLSSKAPPPSLAALASATKSTSLRSVACQAQRFGSG